MERGDVGVADESLRVPAKHVWIQIRDDSHGTVPPGGRDHGLHVRVAPHRHQILGALFVLALMEAALLLNVGFEKDLIACLLHGLRTAKEPSSMRRVRRSDHAYSVALLQ